MIPNLFCPVYMYEGSCALLQSYCKGRVQSDVYATVALPRERLKVEGDKFWNWYSKKYKCIHYDNKINGIVCFAFESFAKQNSPTENFFYELRM